MVQSGGSNWKIVIPTGEQRFRGSEWSNHGNTETTPLTVGNGHTYGFLFRYFLTQLLF